MVDVMMGAEQDREVFEFRSRLRKGVLERGHAVGRVHAGIDQRPLSAAAIDQIDVDDRRPHRQRQKEFVNPALYFYDLGWHSFRPSGRRFRVAASNRRPAAARPKPGAVIDLFPLYAPAKRRPIAEPRAPTAG